MAFTAQITSWVNAVQFRDPTSGQLSLYNSMLSAGSTPVQVQSDIISEGYTQSNVNPIIRLYQSAFNRIPDQSGLGGWADTLAASTAATYASTYQSIAAGFANAQEFQTIYGATASSAPTQSLITQFYTNILQRSPSAQEVNGWMTSGKNVGQILADFAYSQEFIDKSTPHANGFSFAEINGTLPSNIYTPLWDIPTSADGSVNLTPQSDTLTANSFNGEVAVLSGQTVNTWNNGDRLTGTGTNPTLNAELVAGGVTITPALLSGVQTVNVNTLTAGTLTVNTQNVTGLQNFSASNLGNNLLTLGALNNALSTLSLDSSGAATVTTVAAAVAGTDDTVTVALNNQTNAGDITFNTSGSTTAGYETIAFESNGAVRNSIGAVTSTGTTKATFSGSADITTGQLANSIVTVDASAATGDVRVTVGNGTVTFTGGAGDDRVTFSSNFNKDDVVDGGEGANSIVASYANFVAFNAANSNVTNVQTLIENSADAAGLVRADFIGDAINRVVFAGDNDGNDNVTVRFNAGENKIDVTDTLGLWAGVQDIGNMTVEANGTAKTDKLILNINGDDVVTTGTQTEDIDIGALNLNSNGRAIEQLEILSNNAATDHQVGAITLPNTVAIDNGIVIKGESTLTLTGAVTADSLDASGITGGAAIVFDAGQASGRAMSIIGSDSGADTLIGSAAADTITTGSGNSIVDGAGGGDAIQLGSGDYTVWYAATVADAALDGGTLPTLSGFSISDLADDSDIINIDVTADTAPSAVGPLALDEASGDPVAAGDAIVMAQAAQGVDVNVLDGANLFKLTTAVATAAGDTAIDLFNDAIGAGSFVNANIDAADDFLVMAYDSTNEQAVIMIIDADNAGAIAAGDDMVGVVATIGMTAAEYANFGANQFAYL